MIKQLACFPENFKKCANIIISCIILTRRCKIAIMTAQETDRYGENSREGVAHKSV